MFFSSSMDGTALSAGPEDQLQKYFFNQQTEKNDRQRPGKEICGLQIELGFEDHLPDGGLGDREDLRGDSGLPAETEGGAQRRTEKGQHRRQRDAAENPAARETVNPSHLQQERVPGGDAGGGSDGPGGGSEEGGAGQ